MIQDFIHTFRLAGLGAVLDVTDPCVVLADEVPGRGRATTAYSGRVVLALDGGTSDGGQIGASFGYKYKTTRDVSGELNGQRRYVTVTTI